jgi:L-amino acid N-acyltransferase YncA
MKIRLAQDTDLAGITEIYNEAVLNSVATFDTETKTLEDRREWFQQFGGPHGLYVAETDGKIAGWACLYRYSDRRAYAATVENSVYIHPDHRGQGLGIALLQALMDHARAHHLHAILARISDGNEASLRLHHRYGFQLVGVMREVGVKFGRLLDVHLLQALIPSPDSD